MQQRRQDNAIVISANQRKKWAVPNNPSAYEMLSPEGTESLLMLRGTVAPGQTSGRDMLQHRGDENLIVLKGAAEFEVEGQAYRLGPGDSIFIPRGQRHRVTNVGSEAFEAIFVLSPPTY